MSQLNSIYESHTRATEKYYTVKNDPEKKRSFYAWEPFARPLTVPGYEDYDFFLLRQETEYGLFEGLTGTLLMTQTKTDKMDMRRIDLSEIAKIIRKRLDMAGGRALINVGMAHVMRVSKTVSPRYTKEPKP